MSCQIALRIVVHDNSEPCLIDREDIFNSDGELRLEINKACHSIEYGVEVTPIDDFINLDGKQIVIRRLGKAGLAVDTLAEFLYGSVIP